MQLLIETDILYDYLTHEASEPSVLRTALSQCTCYTTMLNAMELFRIAATDSEQTAVMNLLMVVRVLGFNSRYAEVFATMAKELEQSEKIILSDREAMIIGMAQASKLTILTKKHHDRYTQINVATVIASVGAGS
jgi:predicted nucleic acid-binding protein